MDQPVLTVAAVVAPGLEECEVTLRVVYVLIAVYI